MKTIDGGGWIPRPPSYGRDEGGGLRRVWPVFAGMTTSCPCRDNVHTRLPWPPSCGQDASFEAKTTVMCSYRQIQTQECGLPTNSLPLAGQSQAKACATKLPKKKYAGTKRSNRTNRTNRTGGNWKRRKSRAEARATEQGGAMDNAEKTGQTGQIRRPSGERVWIPGRQALAAKIRLGREAIAKMNAVIRPGREARAGTNAARFHGNDNGGARRGPNSGVQNARAGMLDLARRSNLQTFN